MSTKRERREAAKKLLDAADALIKDFRYYPEKVDSTQEKE